VEYVKNNDITFVGQPWR